jgi:hypothetical protein
VTDERSLRRYVLRSLWGPLVVVLAVGVAWTVVRWVPMVQVQVMCLDTRGAIYRSIAGRLSNEFRTALRDELGNVPYFAYGYKTLIPLWEAHAGDEVGSASDDAVWTLVERRTGVRRGDLWRGVRVAGFENFGWPTCETTQAIAIWNGVWAREDPAPIWRRPSPGIEAPDYSREGNLPPVEKWGLALDQGSIAAGVLLLVGLGLRIFGGHRVAGWKRAARPGRYRRWGGFIGVALTLAAMILPNINW